MSQKDQSLSVPLDPQLVELWEKGSLSVVSIGPIDYSAALALRHRLYRFRLKMYRKKHPASAQVSRASITIIPPKGPGQVHLYVAPTNRLIAKALEDAGLTATDPPSLD